jgi:hypothetical protein
VILVRVSESGSEGREKRKVLGIGERKEKVKSEKQQKRGSRARNTQKKTHYLLFISKKSYRRLKPL